MNDVEGYKFQEFYVSDYNSLKIKNGKYDFDFYEKIELKRVDCK